MVTDLTELTYNDIRQVNSALYRAGRTARQFPAREIGKRLGEEVTKPTNTKWVSPIVLAPKEEEWFRFCMNYPEQNELTVRDS